MERGCSKAYHYHDEIILITGYSTYKDFLFVADKQQYKNPSV